MPQPSFVALRKSAKADSSALPQYRLALLGDCATQHIATAVKGTAFLQGIGLSVFDADYNQILAQIMDEQSELYAFRPDFVLLCLCTEKLYEHFTAVPQEKRAAFAEDTFRTVQAYWGMLAQHSTCKVLQCSFAEYDDRTFGNYAAKVAESFLFQLRKLNFLLMQGCAEAKHVFMVDVNSVQMQYGRLALCDPKLYCIAKMPFSLELLPEIAKQVVDVVSAVTGRFKKCVVLDLDNTLWGGVIGDDGLCGIQIGELGLGHAFSEFQTWLKELSRRGILLAVCSKNEAEAAKEPFLHHADMVLRLEDFSAFVANWEDKAANIRAIQQTLNIGMDSLVFVDDNPFERNLVRSMIPEICVPELPEDPALYTRYLQGLNLFETASYSEADKQRTDQYRAESGRAALQQQFASFDEYLQSLDMVAEAKPFDAYHFPRIAQLSQRSNQFNLRTVRYTEDQIAALAENPQYLTLYFTLRDKFGDHGLISVVVLQKQQNALFIETWLMSCRVLKRGMEEFIVNHIMETARAAGVKTVIGEYLPTPKNAMVKEIYPRMGFAPDPKHAGRYLAATDEFVFNKTWIKEQPL